MRNSQRVTLAGMTIVVLTRSTAAATQMIMNNSNRQHFNCQSWQATAKF